MSKCFNYLKILTDEEMKDFGVIDFGGRFKSPRKKNYILNQTKKTK